MDKKDLSLITSAAKTRQGGLSVAAWIEDHLPVVKRAAVRALIEDAVGRSMFNGDFPLLEPPSALRATQASYLAKHYDSNDRNYEWPG